MGWEVMLNKAVAALSGARRIVFFTGAGISAESGIPTFRDKLVGPWESYDYQNLETADAFRHNAALVWGFYLWRRYNVKRARPNSAHLVIQQMASGSRHVSVITQNIDDLHERAGSVDVLHLHGSLETPKCFACSRPSELSSEQLSIPISGLEVDPPRCRHCNGRLRPGIVWFKENLPPRAWKAAMRLVRGCDVLVSIGTSGIITPAADIPEIAHGNGATVIHVNLVDVSLGGDNEIMLIGKATQVMEILRYATGM